MDLYQKIIFSGEAHFLFTDMFFHTYSVHEEAVLTKFSNTNWRIVTIYVIQRYRIILSCTENLQLESWPTYFQFIHLLSHDNIRNQQDPHWKYEMSKRIVNLFYCCFIVLAAEKKTFLKTMISEWQHHPILQSRKFEDQKDFSKVLTKTSTSYLQLEAFSLLRIPILSWRRPQR